MSDDNYYPRAGIGNVGSYQTSGFPFLTGSTLLSASFSTNDSEHKIVFPYVCKSITVINKDAAGTPIKVHYNSLADGNVAGGHHYITLSGSSESITMYHRAKEIYISLVTSSADSSYELVADMTNINVGEMPHLTGSGLTS